MSRSAHWCFTINNYTDEDLNVCRSLVDSHSSCNYLCFGLEVGEEGTPHIQGYVQFTDRKRLGTVCRLLGGRAHMEASRGSDQDNVDYCSKTREEDDSPNEIFEEYGERRSIAAKKRSNDEVYTSIKDEIIAGSSVNDIAIAYPEVYIKHSTGIEKMVILLSKKPCLLRYGPFRFSIPQDFNWETCLLLVGPTGIGKTQFAKTLFENPLLVSHIDQLRQFNPLHHGGIIFDDMTFNHMPRTAMIHLTDIDEPRAIHVRYGIVELPANTKKVFTSNVPFTRVFCDDSAVRRRVTQIILE